MFAARLLAVALGSGLLLALPCSAALAAPANVTVRVEGASQTLLPRTAVRTTADPVNKDGDPAHTCTGTGAAGALQLATGGDWSGSWFDGLGYTVERILGESHVFPEPDYFTLWVNNRAATEGICGATNELQEGDEVLFFVDRCIADPVTFLCTNPPVLPLGLKAPRDVSVGVPFDVSVVEYATDGTPSPAAGATIAGGDAPAVTNASGVAAVTIAAGGTKALRATKPNRAPSASETVCAGCIAPPPPPAEMCATDGRDGRCGSRDLTPPAVAITGIREGQRFARGKGPRRLRAVVAADPSGLLTVKLRLTRSDRGRCSYFSGRFERLRPMPCGASRLLWFAVGDRAQVDYLLPSPLPRGRYVLDAVAVDKAYNRDAGLRRGASRVVFHVR